MQYSGKTGENLGKIKYIEENAKIRKKYLSFF
jgi:hypothetical protein